MENLAKNSKQQFKAQRIAQLQKIINSCQILINEEKKEDSKGPDEVVQLVEKLTNGCLEYLENQSNLLVELVKIPKKGQSITEMTKSIEEIQLDLDVGNSADFRLSAEALPVSQNKFNVTTTPLENLINNPGFLHLAKGIFYELDIDSLEVCQNINQASKQILVNPFFWLGKFVRGGGLSKKNQDEWTKAIQSVKKNSEMEKQIVLYLKWTLRSKGGLIDLPCYTNPEVQDDFQKQIWKAVHLSDENIEIVTILAPLTNNPNAPNACGHTPICCAAFYGHTEIVKILAQFSNNPNAPNKWGCTPIFIATCYGHTKVVKILATLTDNPNAPDEDGRTTIYWAATKGHTEIVKILAPLTDNPNAQSKYGVTPSQVAKTKEIENILESFNKPCKN